MCRSVQLSFRITKQVPGYSPKHDSRDSCTLPVVYPTGLKKILEVAGTVPEITEGPPITENTHMNCSVLLNKLYDDLKGDRERENFNKLCEEYIQ